MEIPQTLVQQKNGAEVLRAIEELDLEPIMVKLMDPEEGDGWSLEETKEAVRWYKRFLFLNFKHSDKPIVPSRNIDAVWHAHILYTRKYAEDCEMVFGSFMHHELRGPQDGENLKTAFAGMEQLYLEEFGESPPPASNIIGGCQRQPQPKK